MLHGASDGGRREAIRQEEYKGRQRSRREWSYSSEGAPTHRTIYAPSHDVGMLHGASDGGEREREPSGRREDSGAGGSGRRPRDLGNPRHGGQSAALVGSAGSPLGIFVDEAAEERGWRSGGRTDPAAHLRRSAGYTTTTPPSRPKGRHGGVYKSRWSTTTPIVRVQLRGGATPSHDLCPVP